MDLIAGGVDKLRNIESASTDSLNRLAEFNSIGPAASSAERGTGQITKQTAAVRAKMRACDPSVIIIKNIFIKNTHVYYTILFTRAARSSASSSG